jgi:hypothetical protein
MLRHYTLPTHEPCQTFNKSFFFTVLFFTICINSLKITAQTADDFEIKLKLIEYIDANTDEHAFIDADSTNTVLNLTRNYNHIYIALEEDPSIQYSYKVTNESHLSQWKNTGSEIHLVGLSRGDHELFIRGEQNGVISSNILHYDIFVKTPFYLTWWCISIFIILALLMFYSFLSLESKLLEERRDRNLEVTNLEGRAYRAQMNPHFIFNALNGMQSAMVLGGEKEFNSYISSFSKLIRDTIDMSSVDKITVADEIKYITNYVKLQDHRLDEKVDLEIHVDPKINQNDVYLPCMMLQPIIENAIVHGIIPKQDSGIIKIGLTIQESMLRICVTDNGIGREAAAAQKEKYTKHKSYATQIMRDRIDIFNYYNQQKLAFSIEDLFDEAGAASGTKVTLLVPLELKTRN